MSTIPEKLATLATRFEKVRAQYEVKAKMCAIHFAGLAQLDYRRSGSAVLALIFVYIYLGARSSTGRDYRGAVCRRKEGCSRWR